MKTLKDYIWNGNHSDNHDQEDRAQPADHEPEHIRKPERRSVQPYFLFDRVRSDRARDQEADEYGGYRHHQGVRQKIKEIQKLHADDLHLAEIAVTEAGERSETDHDGA